MSLRLRCDACAQFMSNRLAILQRAMTRRAEPSFRGKVVRNLLARGRRSRRFTEKDQRQQATPPNKKCGTSVYQSVYPPTHTFRTETAMKLYVIGAAALMAAMYSTVVNAQSL
jgi:hypothetical protein